jgi:hypothetical protein
VRWGGVIWNDEEEWGERASLLDSPLDGNVAGGGSPKERGHFNVVEGATDETLKPARESCFLEDFEDPRVVDGIKSFSSIKEKSESLGVISDALIEETVQVFSEWMAACGGEEALLSRVKEGGDGGHNGTGDSASKETVICICNADRAGVRNQASFLLRDQKEETVVEAGGGCEPTQKGTEYAEKDRGRKIRRSSPCSEGDAVGARCRVVRRADGAKDGL